MPIYIFVTLFSSLLNWYDIFYQNNSLLTRYVHCTCTLWNKTDEKWKTRDVKKKRPLCDSNGRGQLTQCEFILFGAKKSKIKHHLPIPTNITYRNTNNGQQKNFNENKKRAN